MLLIQRPDGSWAMPGGFIDPGESALPGALRELGEEAISNISQLAPLFLQYAVPVFAGYTADGRNTDNAWIETTVFALHIPLESAENWHLLARDDARAVRWAPITPELLNTMYSDHGDFVQAALARLEREKKPDANCQGRYRPLAAI